MAGEAPALFASLLQTTTPDDPTLTERRAAFTEVLSIGYKGSQFSKCKASFVAAASEGGCCSRSLVREVLFAVLNLSLLEKKNLARPLSIILLQAAREALDTTDSPPELGSTDVVDFVCGPFSSLDLRLGLDVIKHLAPPAVMACFSADQRVAMQEVVAQVVQSCLQATPPQLVVACGLVSALGLEARWPLEDLLEMAMDQVPWPRMHREGT